MYDIYLKKFDDEIYFYYQKSKNNYKEWVNRINKIKIPNKKNNTFYEFINNLNFKLVLSFNGEIKFEIYRNEFFILFKIYGDFDFFKQNLPFNYEINYEDSISAFNNEFYVIVLKRRNINDNKKHK